MGRRRVTTLLTAALLTGLMVGGGFTAATAVGQATSQTASFTVNGKTYRDFALVKTTSTVATGETRGWGLTTVSAGWLGVNGRLFRSSGAMVGESGFYYNGSTMAGGTVLINGVDYVTTGTFYSYGVVRGWNGSGYNSYYTFKTPYQNN